MPRANHEAECREGGAAFDEALTTQHRLLRHLFGAHTGHEAKELGGGLVVAFEHVTDAVFCAVASQRVLAQTRWPRCALSGARRPSRPPGRRNMA